MGQTSSKDNALLYDSEITFLLTQSGGVYFPAAQAAESLGGKYTALAQERAVGATRVRYLDRAKTYRELAMTLRRQAMTRGVQVYAGNMSVSEAQTDRQNTQIQQPAFQIGMDDNPQFGTTGQSS